MKIKLQAPAQRQHPLPRCKKITQRWIKCMRRCDENNVPFANALRHIFCLTVIRKSIASQDAPFCRPVLPDVKNTCDSDSGSVSSILSSDIMFASSASNNLDASRTRRSWIPSFRIRDAWQSLVTAAGSRCESTMTVAQDMSSSTEASREGGSEVQSGDGTTRYSDGELCHRQFQSLLYHDPDDM